MSSHEQDKKTAEYERQAKEREDKKHKGVAERAGYRVRVDWLGSRALCCRMLVEEQRLWLQYNYGEVLGL